MKDILLLAGTEGRKSHRFVAALLGILLLFQCLPLTVPPPEDFRSPAKVEAKSFFEPLCVCEHGDSPAAYFTDHPWIPGTGFFFRASVREGSFPGAAKVGLAEGFPSAVYKPPRAARS